MPDYLNYKPLAIPNGFGQAFAPPTSLLDIYRQAQDRGIKRDAAEADLARREAEAGRFKDQEALQQTLQEAYLGSQESGEEFNAMDEAEKFATKNGLLDMDYEIKKRKLELEKAKSDLKQKEIDAKNPFKNSTRIGDQFFTSDEEGNVIPTPGIPRIEKPREKKIQIFYVDGAPQAFDVNDPNFSRTMQILKSQGSMVTSKGSDPDFAGLVGGGGPVVPEARGEQQIVRVRKKKR